MAVRLIIVTLASALALWAVVLTKLGELSVYWHGGTTREVADVVTGALPDRLRHHIQTAGIDAALPALAALPTDGYSYLLGAQALLEAGRTDAARVWIQAALSLAPQQSGVLSGSARLLAALGDVRQAMANWSRLISQYPGEQRQVFDILNTVIAHPESRDTLVAAADDPELIGGWIEYAVQQRLPIASVYAVYREASEHALITPAARSAVSQGLFDAGQVDRAYSLWLGGLGDEDREVLGWVYDSDFERPPAGSPFDWRLDRVAGVSSEIEPDDADGRLLVGFLGVRTQFRHVSQQLLLVPGRYRMSIASRRERLQTNAELAWALYCHGERQARVRAPGVSGGNDDQWQETTVDFEIPALGTCNRQILRLEQTGRLSRDYAARGAIAFDHVRIRRLKS